MCQFTKELPIERLSPMPSPTDFEKTRVLIFGGFPGARYRAGRTLRILKPHFPNIIDATILQSADISKIIDAEDSPVWLPQSKARCVRLAHLDCFDDPALRVAQVVTSLQCGGAERITLELTRELPRCGVRALLFTLGSPTRAAFPTPEENVDFPPGRN